METSADPDNVHSSNEDLKVQWIFLFFQWANGRLNVQFIFLFIQWTNKHLNVQWAFLFIQWTNGHLNVMEISVRPMDESTFECLMGQIDI